MNSVLKFLFYRTYEDRASKLKIITVIWFVLWFLILNASGNVLSGFFGSLMVTVPLFSAGLIIRLLFVDDENENSNDFKTSGGVKKENTANVKTSDTVKKLSEKTYLEKDNAGTRHDTVEKANAYWLGSRFMMDEKPPFCLYTFSTVEDAENALLELPFIHKAEDSGNLICDEVFEFGYYMVDDGVYEAVIAGSSLTPDQFGQVEKSFKKHNGTLKNNLEPSGDVKDLKTSEGNADNVVFREKFTENKFTYECYDGKTKTDAMDFLKGRDVSESLYYVCVYTPEGNFGRDINGIYEM